MDASALPPLLLLVALVLAAAAYQAIRRPFLRRLAIRNTRRRPTEVALVLIGSLLGTAIITGSYIVGDSLDSSLRASAFTQLGPIDEYLIVPRDRARAVEQQITALHDHRIDGVMRLTAAPASVTSGSGRSRRAEPSAQLVETDFVAARGFGGDPPATGISGSSPKGHETVITTDLADSLGVTAGDRVGVYLYGHKLTLRVARVVPRLGVAGFWTGPQQTSNNAFVAPGTLQDIAARGIPPGSQPPLDYVLVSNRGGVIGGADLSSPVTGALRRALGPQVRVTEAKHTKLEMATAAGKSFSQLFVSIGTFAVIAGLLLLINIFVMLAEERKTTLGMMRAVGMRRSDLVRGFVIEGIIYSLFAAALGSLFGIAVGWVIVGVAAKIFAGFGDFSLQFFFHFDVSSVVGGFCLGMLMGAATVLITSLRISRINIIRAIRDLQEPLRDRVRLRSVIAGLIVALAGAAWAVGSFGNQDAWPGILLGPPLVAYGAVAPVTRLVGRRLPMLAASAFGIFWGVFANTITGGAVFDSGSMFAFVLQGILLTFSAVVLLSQTQESLETLIRRIAARNLPLRLGLAYPLARRFRTGLTLGMYALVIFTMVFLAVLAVVFGGQVTRTAAKAGGGYSLYVTSSASNPPRADDMRRVPGIERVVPATAGSVLFQPTGLPEPAAWPVTGIDRRFVAGGPPTLLKKAPGMTANETWDRVVSDPSTMIINNFFLQSGGGPSAVLAQVGDRVPTIDPTTGERTMRKVIGMVDSDVVLAGSYMSKKSLRDIIGRRASTDRFYVASSLSSKAAADLANRLQGRFFRNGIKAETFVETVEQQASGSLAFLRLMQGYLALGLVVGIAGLGVVMVRAVRDRTREIGVLRSLGFMPPQVRRSFLMESGFVAAEGILIGTILSLVTAAQLVEHGDFGKGVEFVIPWGNVILLVTIAFVASLVATAWPAQRASKIAPAVALRTAE